MLRIVVVGVVLAIAQPAVAQDACDPVEAEQLRTHLTREASRAGKWNLAWRITFTTAAVGSFTVGALDVFPELTTGLYVSAGKAAIGALARWVLPLRVDVPDPTGDACADVAALRAALAATARRERSLFYMGHVGGILVNGAGAAIITVQSGIGQGLLSVAIGYPIGLLSNYTMPRGSWHRYRERTWTVAAVPRHDGWLVTVGGAF